MNRKRYLIIIFCVLAAGLWLFWQRPELLWQLLIAHKIAWLVLLVLAISPLSREKIALPDSRHYSFLSWLSRISLLQIGLYIIFAGLWFASRQLDFAATDMPQASLQQFLQQLLWHGGLYPWVFYAIFLLVIQQNAKGKQSLWLVNDIPANLFAERNHFLTKSISNFYLLQARLFVLLLTLAIFVLVIAKAINSWLGLPLPLGLNLQMVVLVSILQFFLLSTLKKRLVTRIKNWPIPVAMALAVGTILLMAYLIISNLLFSFTIKTFSPNLVGYFSHPIIQNWHSTNERLNQLSLLLWWLGVMPYICAYLLHISGQRSAWQVWLGMLALPLLITGLAHYPWPEHPVESANTALSLSALLASGGLILIIGFFARSVVAQKMLGDLRLLIESKHYLQWRLLNILLHNLTAITALLLIATLLWLAVISQLLLLPVSIFLFVAMLALLKQALKKSKSPFSYFKIRK